MGKIWRNRLIAGTQFFSECPDKYKEEVVALLKEEVANGNPDCTAERFEEITGMPYNP